MAFRALLSAGICSQAGAACRSWLFPDHNVEKKKAPAVCRCFLCSWSRRDSNSPLSDCEPDALPDELRPQTLAVLKSIFENLATGWTKRRTGSVIPVLSCLVCSRSQKPAAAIFTSLSGSALSPLCVASEYETSPRSACLLCMRDVTSSSLAKLKMSA